MLCKKHYKDMDKYRATRERYKAKYRRMTGAGVYNRRPWTEEEVDMVLAHEIPDRELSEKINRSVGSIQIMRTRVKK